MTPWEERQKITAAFRELTPAEIDRILQNHVIKDTFDGEEYEDSFSYHSLEEFTSEPMVVPGLGKVTAVQQYGGEGQGDQLWLVFKIQFEDTYLTRYFKKTGYYQSYEGGEYDGDLFEVKPAEHVVTIYERV